MAATEIRPTETQLWLYPAIGVLLGATQMLSERPILGAAFFVAFVGVGFAARGWGIDLTPEALVMRGFSRREIPWSQITAIEARKSLGMRMLRPRLADGSAARPRAPYTGFLQTDPEFDAKVERVEEYWREHRRA